MLPFNCFPNSLISREGNASYIILVLQDKQGSEVHEAGVGTARKDVFLAKYQNLFGPSHNGLFQGDSQADKFGTTHWSEISGPSVFICPSASPTQQRTSVTERAPEGLDHEASQVTNLKVRVSSVHTFAVAVGMSNAMVV